jgi:outer membrane protein TolC
MSRKRWIKRILAGILTMGAAGGCKQQVFMEPQDYRDAVTNTLPRDFENRPNEPILPGNVIGPNTRKPVDVLDPDRPARMMTLRECIALALEQGNVGNQVPTAIGTKVDLPNQFTGRAVTGSDSIRVFAVDPATQAAELERSLSKFDARWINSVSWQKVDTPTAAQFLSFQNSRDVANLTSTLEKPLPTGGTAAITLSTDYSKFNNVTGQPGFVNPNYIPQMQFTFEQPLLKLFGVEANQLATAHPGSTVLNPQTSGGNGTEGILISRIRVDQQKAQFDIRVNYMLASVETAYWNLYAAYYNLFANEEGLRQAFDGFRFIATRVQVGSDPSQNEDQARAQFERFRRQVIESRGQVFEAERQLRGFLGLRSDDGNRIVPIDKPTEVAYRPDFYEAANEAMANRPELLQARQDLKANQLNLLLQKNLRRADVRFFTQYSIAGLGTRLDGSQFVDPGKTVPGNALTNWATDRFHSWNIGMRADIPLGFRDANAFVREAQLSLAKSYYQLRDSEMKVLEYVVQQYRNVIQAHAVISPAREERKALQLYLGKTKEVILIGNWNAAYFQNYLTVQEQLATAIATEFQAIATYNSALAQLEFAKGTIQQYNNVSVNEGPLPPWVQKRAADHIRERTEAAFKLREREAPSTHGPILGVGGTLVGPPVGTGMLGDIPPFAEKHDPLPDKLPDGAELKKMNPPQPVDPSKLPDGKGAPDVKMGPGGLLGNTGGVPKSVGVPPSITGSGGTTAAEDYFRPIGTVSLPARGTSGGSTSAPSTPPGGSGSSTTPGKLPTSAPAPVPQPAGTGMDTLPIPPVPPVGGVKLPVPPPSTDGDFSPSGSLPRIPPN